MNEKWTRKEAIHCGVLSRSNLAIWVTSLVGIHYAKKLIHISLQGFMHLTMDAIWKIITETWINKRWQLQIWNAMI